MVHCSVFSDTRGLLNLHSFSFLVGFRICSLCPEEAYERSRDRQRERTSSVNVHRREFVLVETFICFQNLMITMCFVNWCSSSSLYPRYHREVVRRRRKRRYTTAARWVGGRGDQEGWGGREWGWSIKWRRYQMGRKLQVGKEAQQGQDRSGDTLATLWRVVASFMCLVAMAKMSVRHRTSMSLIVVRISAAPPAATTHRHKPYVKPLCVLYSRVLGHCCNEF